jgi:hypothetical protein
MITKPSVALPLPTTEEIQKEWVELRSRIGQLEARNESLEHSNKALGTMLERVIEHRQKSHSELILLLAGLVSKLPINDVGVVVSKLVEHNTNVGQFLAALIKGTVDAEVVAQPEVLRTLDQTKRDLAAALKPVVEELIKLDTSLEPALLNAIPDDPEQFFAPRQVRANRCFVKGQVARERILREFGAEALVLFNDLTTDPKLNPRPKPDEIVLGFKNDFEAILQQNPNLLPEKRKDLTALYQRIQRGKKNSEEARAQKNAFQRLSYLAELLHYYKNQSTEAPDVLFAQRLPTLVEQLVVPGAQDALEEKAVLAAEALMAYVIGTEHRQVIVNNLGKGGGAAKSLKYVLRLRCENATELDNTVTEFVKHLIPAAPASPPKPEELAAILRLIKPERQRRVAKAIMVSDRLRKEPAEALGKAVGALLGLTGLDEPLRPEEVITPEMERQRAWTKIKDLITQRNDAAIVAATMRDRLHAKYDADEIRQSWLTLAEADPISLIRIVCQLPYLPNGNTDPIARTILESYTTRLTHEKYTATYNKVVNSLRTMYQAKPDSPTLVTFVALVRWADPEAAGKMCRDIGMPLPAH